ncbi:MAG: dTDP-4-dehydrorhamnose reductase [Candidatus Gracilibacteria bacterium]|nr:dTDP-4-dehydrorhamnose reductase [Candidatus Gracilibacteria bacterium]
MKKILLTGAKGMLAHDFIELAGDKFEITSTDKEKLDVVSYDSILKLLENNKFDLILNLAAYTNVEDAEDVGAKLNFDVNAIGVYNLAKVAKIFDIDFITISTDYVFDGTKVAGFEETDIQNPINNYGLAKYLGEKLAFSENEKSIIIRTSWLYGGGKEYKNFVNTMLKLGETKDVLTIVNDQFGSPTYAVGLGKAILEIIDQIKNFRGKILHLSNETPINGITWFDFANEIFKLSGKDIKLISCKSEEYKTKAKRPFFSKLKNNGDIKLRNWEDGLKEYLNNL